MDIYSRIILSVVLFHNIKKASTTIRITEFIDESSRRTGIFEGRFRDVLCRCVHISLKKFRLNSHHIGVVVEASYEWLKPSRRTLHIAVEQHEIVGIDCINGFIIAIGIAPILLKSECFDCRKTCPEQFERVVGGSIIDNPYFSLLHRVLNNVREEATHHLRTVPIEYDDSRFHCFLSVFFVEHRCYSLRNKGSDVLSTTDHITYLRTADIIKFSIEKGHAFGHGSLIDIIFLTRIDCKTVILQYLGCLCPLVELHPVVGSDKYDELRIGVFRSKTT